MLRLGLVDVVSGLRELAGEGGQGGLRVFELGFNSKREKGGVGVASGVAAQGVGIRVGVAIVIKVKVLGIKRNY